MAGGVVNMIRLGIAWQRNGQVPRRSQQTMKRAAGSKQAGFSGIQCRKCELTLEAHLAHVNHAVAKPTPGVSECKFTSGAGRHA